MEDFPKPSVGAPNPVVLADEGYVVLAYFLNPADRTGGRPRIVSPLSNEPLCIVLFTGCHAHMFGPPNDEAFDGHPLAGFGLEPYGVYRVENSSWIRSLERMNSVHPSHRPDFFRQRQHLIFAFHDSTFECVCRAYEVTTDQGPMTKIVSRMVAMLGWENPT